MNFSNAWIGGEARVWSARLAEAIVIALACLAPWAFGAVEAWAILCLDLGISVVLVLTFLGLRKSSRQPLFSLPALALAGLVVLSLVQATPLPPSVLRTIAPSAFSLRTRLIPSSAESVRGDLSPPIPLPSSTISLVPAESLHTATQLTAALVLFQCVLTLGGGYAALKRFAIATCVNATLLAIFALIQALTWNGCTYWLRPSTSGQGAWSGGGPFVCHNHFAEYTNIGLGFAIGLLLGSYHQRTAARGTRVWATYAVGVLIVGVLISFSRGGFLAMLLASGITVLLLKSFSNRSGRRSYRMSLVAIPLVALALLATIGDSSAYIQRLSTLLNPSQEASLYGRVEIWKTSFRTWTHYPIWGSGFGSFPDATAPYYQHDWEHVYNRAENEFVDVLVEGGLIGLGIGLAALFSIARLARLALLGAPPKEQGLILGTVFGGMAIFFQIFGDFGLHIPGVGVSVVILAAHLSRLGLDTSGEVASTEAKRHRTAATTLVFLTMLVAMSLVLVHQVRQARAEFPLYGNGIPMPGSSKPSADESVVTRADLQRKRTSLEESLAISPDWVDGHLWLGKVYLNLYLFAEDHRLGGNAQTTGDALPEAEPLWLLKSMQGSDSERILKERLGRSDDPIRQFMVPAARCYLEARRCCPASGLTQAKLASLSFLLENGDPPVVYAERALSLTGSDEEIVDYIAEVAVRLGHPELAARAWRKSLALRPTVWPLVANSASQGLTPEQILDDLLVDGGHTLRFAESLYTTPEQREIKDRFLRASLQRLPNDPDLGETERRWLQAQALAGLGKQDEAHRQMDSVLRAEPQDSDRRARYVTWLLEWGDLKEAHRQALTGSRLDPTHQGLSRALRQAVDALAKGTQPRDDPGKR